MTLDEFVSQVGEDKVRALFTEYAMLAIAKADKLDEVVRLLDEGATVEDIRKALA